MIINFKDSFKLVGISVVACCAVFVITLFLNYNLDLLTIDSSILTQAGKAMYEAHISMGKVIIAVTGGCLALTSIIMLLFYIKNHIDSHSKELGILKAMGYSNISVAKHFWVFGLSIFLGCVIGFVAAYIYMPTFYEAQNAEQLFPAMAVNFHFTLLLILIILPTVLFMVLSIFYAYYKLKKPVLDLLLDRKNQKIKKIKESKKETPFLKELKRSTIRSRKMLVFFIIFSAFCFSAMVQMSLSMTDLSSQTFAWMILMIGLILAFMTLFMSLSNVVNSNAKTIAMMRVQGYDSRTCSNTILGVYRPYAIIGFILGTIYQYGLLKLVLTFVFSNIENVPAFSFNWKALLITLIAFVLTYELIMLFYSYRVKKSSLKSIMAE